MNESGILKEEYLKLTPDELTKYISTHMKLEHEFRGEILAFCLEIEHFLDMIISRHYTFTKLRTKFLNDISPEIGFRGKIKIFKKIEKKILFPTLMNCGSKEKLIENLEDKILGYRNSMTHDTSSMFENMKSSKKSKKTIHIIQNKTRKPQQINATLQKDMEDTIRKTTRDLANILTRLDK